MSCHISIRDVQFTPSEKGVRIIVLTDVPSHLWCRLTSQEPWVHKKATFKRGVFWKEDVRFCFTVYEDNEQFEDGDTHIHTFWKENWPPCTTKWVYFWGSIAAEVCASDTPFFVYHNTGEAPVPPPDALYTFNAIEPNFRRATASGVWTPVDLSYELHPDATGVIIQIVNLYAGAERQVGLRKAGTTYDMHRDMRRRTQTWAICGVSDAKILEVWAESHPNLDLWIMGYTGRNVHFLDVPIDILPPVPDVWTDVDASAIGAGLTGVILNTGRLFGGIPNFAVRKKGSTDDRYRTTFQSWPVVGVDTNGVFQIKMHELNPVLSSAFITGYFTTDCNFATNGIDISPSVNDTWQTRSIDKFLEKPRWGLIEVRGLFADKLYGAQKGYSRRDLPWNSYAHDWVFVHCTNQASVELYCETPGAEFWLIGTTH